MMKRRMLHLLCSTSVFETSLSEEGICAKSRDVGDEDGGIFLSFLFLFLAFTTFSLSFPTGRNLFLGLSRVCLYLPEE